MILRRSVLRSFANTRMPSASFSVAIASSFMIHRKVVSSFGPAGSGCFMSTASLPTNQWQIPSSAVLRERRSAAAGIKARLSSPSSDARASISAGAIVSRSHPANDSIWFVLRNDAPLTIVSTSFDL